MTVHESISYAFSHFLAAGIEDPLVDARVLVAWAIAGRKEDLIREPERSLTGREELIFRKAVELRSLRRPLAYITGERGFYGRSFKVNRAVLIPRWETEMIVDFCLAEAAPDRGEIAIADIGTGSGCIAVTLACELPNARIDATDISHLALLVAAKNVRRYGVSDRVCLYCGDLLTPLTGRQYNIIVSNPPYIGEREVADLMPEVRDYEPALALYDGAGEDGTLLYSRLVEEAKDHLLQGGWLVLEVGRDQAATVVSLLCESGYKDLRIQTDFNGIERLVAGRFTEVRELESER